MALGPQFGTVGGELIRDAAKEAVRFADLLVVVCGFAFEAITGEETTQFGRLTILKAKMNPDLDAWSTLYSATSRAFPRPASGKIAVKVMNHYGDEIMKVYAM